jgi:hypothetical protein
LNLSIHAAPGHEHITNPQEMELFNGEINVTAPGINHIKAYPEDGIKTIVGSESNINGKVELTRLKGLGFMDDPLLKINNSKNRQFIAELQQIFFPFWPDVSRGEAKMPVTLREIEAFIHLARDSSNDSLIVETAEEMLVACEQFRFWGTEQLEKDATLIRAGRLPAGYVHTYSPTSDVLLRQLEIPRESFTGQTQVNAPAQPTSPELIGALQLLAQNQDKLTELLSQKQPEISTEMAKKAEAIEAKATKSQKTEAQTKTTPDAETPINMSILESIGRQRALLDYPRSNRPSLHQHYEATMRNIQRMYNRVANSNEAFGQDEKLLTVDASSDTFTVSNSADSRFGKVLLVTTYSADPQAAGRSIDFSNMKDITFENAYPANYQGGWFEYLTGGKHSAEKMAFFYDPEGRLRVKISPKPQATAEYKVRFSIGNWAKNAGLNSSPVLSQYHHLFELQTCRDVLFMCEWDGIDSDARQLKIREMKESYNDQESRDVPDFERFLRSITSSKVAHKAAWDGRG